MVSSNLIIAQTGFSSQSKFKQQNNVVHPLAAPSKRSALAPYPLHAHKSYAQINFKSRMALHKSWGAAVDTAKNVNFRLFTWPDVKKVFVQVADNLDKTAKSYEANDLEIVSEGNGAIKSIKTNLKNSQLIELENLGEGIFEHKVGSDVAKEGHDYRFVIIKKDNTIETVKDPYAARQPDILGWSKIYDHNRFQWNDKDWINHKVKERISRRHYENGLTNPYTMSIYEMQIATATKERTFEAAKKELKRAKKLGFDAVELMPIGNTYSYNWGYDEVDKFAPQESILGGPDKLKELVDYAHKLKLNIIGDVVPNHVGPDGDFLDKTGPYMKGGGQFGNTFNYEGENSRSTREYMANVAMNLVGNYHFDAIRFDMTKPHYTGSDFMLKKINMELHHHYPDVFTIAEDGEGNREKVTRALSDWEENIKREKGTDGKEHIIQGSDEEHIERMNWLDDKIYHKDLSATENIGFDSEWDFPYQKQIAAAILGNWEKYNKNLDHLYFATAGSQHRVKYPFNHDDYGNNDGTTAMDKITSAVLWLFGKTKGRDDCQKGQRAAHSAHRFNVAVATGKTKDSDADWAKLNLIAHMNDPLSKQQATDALYKSYRLSKLALGDVFSARGPKQITQTMEDASLEYFKFAREYSFYKDQDKEKAGRRILRQQSLEKGYLIRKPALESSTRGSIDYSAEYKEKMRRHASLIWKLNKMIHEIPALNDGEIVSAVNHKGSSVSGIHRKKNDSEVFVVKNFNEAGYTGNYEIQFPSGKWKQILNSDSKRFGGPGEFENTQIVDSNNAPKISLPPCSFVVFEKIKNDSAHK